MDSTTLTVRLPAETRERLSALAAQSDRSRSYLAGQAIKAFVDREWDIACAVERGREDSAAGRLVDHDAAMDELDAIVHAAQARA